MIPRATPEQVAAVYDAPLDEAEFDRRLAAALADEDQMLENVALIRWFMGRYKTPRERLRYARRKYAEVQR